MKVILPKLQKIIFAKFLYYTPLLFFIICTLALLGLNIQNSIAIKTNESYSKIQIASASAAFSALKNQDQYKINQALTAEVKNINQTYTNSIKSYENMTDLKAQKIDTAKADQLYAQIVKYLSVKNYASASATITSLDNQIQQLTPKPTPPPAQAAGAGGTAAASNSLPGSGLSRQVVSVNGQNYTIDIIVADLNSTKVIVDTASDSDCRDNCPVMTLADYANRNGAWAAVNGNFFCPADYPSCAGKVNSFDTLVMNKSKHYFNSDNNVYSVVPIAIFRQGSSRFLGKSQEWGRDTSPDAVIANYPQLVVGGNVAFTENPSEPKFGNKGTRDFIAGKDHFVYIGTIFNATMGEAAQVLKTLGVQDALNLDEGGSTALWFGGHYLAGPGRNIPNAVLFVNR